MPARQPLGAFHIARSRASNAVAVAEIELGEVPMQVLFRAFHAALEDAEKNPSTVFVLIFVPVLRSA